MSACLTLVWDWCWTTFSECRHSCISYLPSALHWLWFEIGFSTCYDGNCVCRYLLQLRDWQLFGFSHEHQTRAICSATFRCYWQYRLNYENSYLFSEDCFAVSCHFMPLRTFPSWSLSAVPDRQFSISTWAYRKVILSGCLLSVVIRLLDPVWVITAWTFCDWSPSSYQSSSWLTQLLLLYWHLLSNRCLFRHPYVSLVNCRFGGEYNSCIPEFWICWLTSPSAPFWCFDPSQTYPSWPNEPFCVSKVVRNLPRFQRCKERDSICLVYLVSYSSAWPNR